KGANPRFKYHMFKRLNTGGDLLSEQQLRNCTIRMLDSQFPNFIIDMASVESFRDCTRALTQERRLSAFDQELVLRFFALKNRRTRFKHGVSDFLTEYMEDVADVERPEEFNYAAEEAQFRKTFESLQKTLNEYAFAFAKKDQSSLNAGFSTYHYEAITIGLQVVLDRLDLAEEETTARLKNVLYDIKLDPNFIDITTGGGKNSPGPLNQRIGFVEGRLRDAFA
ncbi:MAG: hypothetical protein KIT00_00410, partial [Rhodospirillales bacterium]|nr:hypothetical protein [Rhodospirillales bacterium]